jgi:hypothetical protein
MNRNNYKLSDALRRLIDAIDILNEDDFSKFSDESYTIEVKFIRRRNKEDIAPTIGESEIKIFIEKLINISSREEAHNFLNINLGTKKSLELIAKKLDILISKQDKIEIIRDKIIEATVGARIRSQAIQGGAN